MNPPSAVDIDAAAAGTPAPQNGRAPLGLVVTLCARLAQVGVGYCHWKSNDMIHLSASGENDLDLLVARDDLGAFLAVLGELGFKEARPRPGRQIPGVRHFYGCDVETGRLVHVDAQAHLVLGDDTTKNVRLPIEAAYLASARRGAVFVIPAPEFELAVLVLRIALKRGTLDALAFGLAGLRAAERRELEDLWSRVDGDRLREVVRTHLAVVGWHLWEAYAEALRSGAPVLTRLRLGRRVVGSLAPYSRRPPAADGVFRSLRRVEWGVRRFFLGQRSRKRLASSGAVVALIGGDGAGKSTAVDGLARWLGGPLRTRRVHLGKPPRSPSTLLVKGACLVARRTGLLGGSWLPTYPSESERGTASPGTSWLAWQLVTARDRRRLYRRATRWAARGDVVVCDRFPVPQLTLMDGARTRWVDPATLGRLGRWLVAAERRCYDEMPRPDVLVVLRVDPDIAVARKRGVDPAEFVRSRSAEVYVADWNGTGIEVVDAGQPADAVLRDLRRIVWSRL